MNRLRWVGVLVLAGVLGSGRLRASENVPHTPFAQWVDLPGRGQFRFGVTYLESESYHIWAGHDYQKVDYLKDGEHYGIDINQGQFAFQYGLTEKWAADLTLGVTTAAWRYFSSISPAGEPVSTRGLTDASFGVRYQVCAEGETDSVWKPTLTLRAGAILPGTFQQDLPFAPGVRSAAIEPEVMIRRHVGWPGLGVYGDGLFRWNRTTDSDQFIAALGVFQEIGRWELDAGFRHLGTVSGPSIQFDPATRRIDYPIGVRENNEAVEAGFSYTTATRHIRLGFYSRTVVGGVNTDRKFWVGGFLEIPFTGRKPKQPAATLSD